MITSSLGFTEEMLFGMNRVALDGAKVLDWERAAEIGASTDEPVWAGLAEDWDLTHGMIWDGKSRIVDYVYVFSRWATPVVVIGDEWGEGIECFAVASPESSSDYPDWWLEEAR